MNVAGDVEEWSGNGGDSLENVSTWVLEGGHKLEKGVLSFLGSLSLRIDLVDVTDTDARVKTSKIPLVGLTLTNWFSRGGLVLVFETQTWTDSSLDFE